MVCWEKKAPRSSKNACENFSTPDYILEPSVFNTLMRCSRQEGLREVIRLLSDNYTAVAQTINLLAQWLIQTGVEPVQVQETVENHLKNFSDATL